MSRKRQLLIGFLVLFAFVLQLSVLPQFKLFGAQPNLILVIAVVVAVQDGPVAGAVVGFAGGLLMDMVSPQVMGIGAFSTAAAAFIAGMLKDFFMTYSILLPVILVFLASLLQMSLAEGGLAMLGQEPLPVFNAGVLFAAALYNVLWVFLIYPLMRRFRFMEKEESLVLNRPSGIGGR